MRRLLMICALLALTMPAQALTFKIATIAPDGTAWMDEMRKGAGEIKERTSGRVKFRFFPGGIMGNDKSVLRKIRIGQLHGGAIVSGGLTAIYPDVGIYSLPFTFRTEEEVDYVRQKMDPMLIDGLQQNGFVSFGLAEGGFAYLMSNQSIKVVDDFKGQKVWVPQNDDVSREAFESIGISPISLALSDVLTGLQTGLIDTIAGSASGAIALQWHTRVKYLMDEPLSYLYASMVISQKRFKRISADDQKIVSEVMGDTFKRLNKINREDDVSARAALQEQGITFIKLSPQLTGQWFDIRKNVEQSMTQKGVLSKEIVTTLQKHLDDYRSRAVASQNGQTTIN